MPGSDLTEGEVVTSWNTKKRNENATNATPKKVGKSGYI
jgi:hypothetical protein